MFESGVSNEIDYVGKRDAISIVATGMVGFTSWHLIKIILEI